MLIDEREILINLAYISRISELAVRTVNTQEILKNMFSMHTGLPKNNSGFAISHPRRKT